MLWESERQFKDERISKAKEELADNQQKLEELITQMGKKSSDNTHQVSHHEIYAQAQAEYQDQI